MISFVNETTRMSDEDLQNAATNLYNKSPSFRAIVDDIADSTQPVTIHITDYPPKGSDTSKTERGSRAETQPRYRDEFDYDKNKDMHSTFTRDENGIIPYESGAKAGTSHVYIDTHDLDGMLFAADKDGDLIADDPNNDGIGDFSAPFTFERVLAHEVFHVRQAHDGLRSSDAIDAVSPVGVAGGNKSSIEIHAAKFENKVMTEITRPGDPRGLPRAYYGNRSGVKYPDSESTEIQIVDASKPEEGHVKPPWDWEQWDVNARLNEHRFSKDTPADDVTASKFVDVEEKGAPETPQSTFAGEISSPLPQTPDATPEPSAPSPATPDASM